MSDLSRSELARLLDDPHATVEHAALLVAKDAYPALDVERCLGELDRWSRQLGDYCAARSGWDPRTDPFNAARAISGFLFGALGFEGNQEDYYDPRNSYLNEVIERRRGIPLTLAIVILAIVRRLGDPSRRSGDASDADGVLFPGHFLVRLGGPSGCYIDPFLGARILSTLDLEILVKRAAGPQAELRSEHLAVADARAMITRMLNNLRAIFERRGDAARGMLVCDRLVDLGAGPTAVRDRGLFALARGSLETARSDLARYLAESPEAADRDKIERALTRARGANALN